MVKLENVQFQFQFQFNTLSQHQYFFERIIQSKKANCQSVAEHLCNWSLATYNLHIWPDN